MGMSATQARLLYLTTQLNNLSLRGQTVSDAKARLALDTQEIQNKYINALNSSRLYLNTNIFANEGVTTQTEYISLANLQANGLMVSDGSKLLGYKWEQVKIGGTELIATGEYEDDLTKPIYPTKEVPATSYSAPNPEAAGDIEAMSAIVAGTGLSKEDLDVQTYTTNINGKETDLNAIVIKSQEGFDAIYELLQKESDEGITNNALSQNYVFDLDSVDLSKYSSTGIKDFQGIFDGNGVTLRNLQGIQGLFQNVSGTVKNINFKNAMINSDLNGIGVVAGYLEDGGLIENCNIISANITSNLQDNVEDAYIGGVVGLNGGTIQNTYADGRINLPFADETWGNVGGFVGANAANIVNDYSSVNIFLGDDTQYSDTINAFIGDNIGGNVTNSVNNGTKYTSDETSIPDSNPELSNGNVTRESLNALQQNGLAKTNMITVPDTDAEPIGYEKKPVYIELPKCEYKLVEDPDFKISSLALEEGLRSGAYTFVQQAEQSSSDTISLNGLYFKTIDLSSCSMVTDETDQDMVTKAEAEFNRDMAEIQVQDKRYEMDQKKIDTQYQAYLAEEESLKTILSKNVERSYKTFSG